MYKKSRVLLQVTDDEFWHILTPLQLAELFEVYNNNKFEDYKNEWEVMRMETMMNINMHLKSGERIKDPKKLMLFSWEREQQKKEIYVPSNQEWEELDKKIKE